MSTDRKTPRFLTPTERRQIINRLDQGESAASLCKQFGVTHSALYYLRKRYRERGEVAIEGAPYLGCKPNPKLNRTHEKFLRELFSDPQSPLTDPSLIDVGNATKAQVAIKEKFGFKPSAEECARVLSKFNTQHILLPSRFIEYEESFPADFLAWQKSSGAKQLLRREKSYLKKRDKIDVPAQPGSPPIANRHWIATLRLFHIDDPLLHHSQGLAHILDRIAAK